AQTKNFEKSNNDGNIPLMLAIASFGTRNDCYSNLPIDILRQLEDDCKQNKIQSQLSLILEIITRTRNVEHANKAGDTSLMLAIKFDFEQAVDNLIARGANIRAVNNDGDTLFYWQLAVNI
ncbi:MAG: hypothetical protein AAF153_03585, partial [Pseudomonadota bacterium]